MDREGQRHRRAGGREPRIATILIGAQSPTEIEADVAALETPIPQTAWPQLKQRFRLD